MATPIDPREIVAGYQALAHLIDAGLIENDAHRVVIDIDSRDLMRVYVERVGSRRWFDILVDAVGKAEIVTDPDGLAEADRRRAERRAEQERRFTEREARFGSSTNRARTEEVQVGGTAQLSEIVVEPPRAD